MELRTRRCRILEIEYQFRKGMVKDVLQKSARKGMLGTGGCDQHRQGTLTRCINEVVRLIF